MRERFPGVGFRAALNDGRFLQVVAEALGYGAMVAQSHQGGPAEISAPGVTKASGLQHWCDELGIAASDVERSARLRDVNHVTVR